MNKFNKFAAAAAAFALAVTSAGCGAPEAITIGKGTQTALTIDGYDIPAGVFIYNEITAYNNAAYELYAKNNTEPSLEDVKNATIEDMSATDWIQNKAVEACKDFVANEKEFEKIGETLSAEELDNIKKLVSSNSSNEMFTENGIGEESLRKIIENSYKQEAIFKHYYGIGGEKGCTEDELKEYFQDKTTRLKYFTINLLDQNGEKYSDEEIRTLNKMADQYVKDINAEKTDKAKLAKIDECEEEYNEYAAKLAEEAAKKAAEEAGETYTTTTTTTTTAAKDATTTTTTTDPYEKEITMTKYTTTTADESAPVTTTASAEAEASLKAFRDYNTYIFDKLDYYKAEKYQYDENTIYVIIKADIKERMTEDDLWSEENVEALISERYYSEFTDMMKSIAEGYDSNRNSSAFRKFSPFKLKLETEGS
ncbi:MAG: hypothetical protein IKH96_08355 [Ruminococcus sp.]|uniref:hypothetical protein n=1 Tax=Ruminococcus sp. TaxID=41978 RepID=UPI0025CD0426|nr:hypothetical protein [Ruminococcus sp.]MBR6996016.1 hypothetical protein [Ruminococcus sp.]